MWGAAMYAPRRRAHHRRLARAATSKRRRSAAAEREFSKPGTDTCAKDEQRQSGIDVARLPLSRRTDRLATVAALPVLVQRGNQLGAAETPPPGYIKQPGGHSPRWHRDLRASQLALGCKRLEPESDSPWRLDGASARLVPSRERDRQSRLSSARTRRPGCRQRDHEPS